MSLISVEFLFFCVLVLLVYYLVKSKVRWIVLLLASLFFYCLAGPKYVCYILISAISTYACARLIEHFGAKRDAYLQENKESLGKEEKKAYKTAVKKKQKLILFLCVLFTLVVPHATLQLSLFMKFRYFDILGIMNFLGGGVIDAINITGGKTSINFINSNWPLYILSLTGLAYKNGLYIFMLRQFFRGIPDELEESAYLDGSGIMRTFFSIIVPLSTTMMITVFMFAFCWQWTDNFYTDLFYTTAGDKLLPDIIKIPKSLDTNYAGQSLYSSAITNTCGILIITPLIILYLFGQRYIVQGIERAGLTAD